MKKISKWTNRMNQPNKVLMRNFIAISMTKIPNPTTKNLRKKKIGKTQTNSNQNQMVLWMRNKKALSMRNKKAPWMRNNKPCGTNYKIKPSPKNPLKIISSKTTINILFKTPLLQTPIHSPNLKLIQLHNPSQM